MAIDFPESLRRAAIQSPDREFSVVIAVNPAGKTVAEARALAIQRIQALGELEQPPGAAPPDNPFLFASLKGANLIRLIENDSQDNLIASIEEEDFGFNKRNLTNTIILEPLLSKIQDRPDLPYDVIIDINQDAPEGRAKTIAQIIDLLVSIGVSKEQIRRRPDSTHPYIFARLTGVQIQAAARADQDQARARQATAKSTNPNAPLGPFLLAYKVWEDTEVRALISRSIATVKADAAQIAFSARGRDVVWCVLDSGIDGGHIHFQKHKNLELPKPIQHVDFTSPNGANPDPLRDDFGHGTHVAGILAGETALDQNTQSLHRPTARIVSKVRNEDGSIGYASSDITSIAGMAPECKLVSMKVLDERGRGKVSALIEAIETIQQINDYGRRILIHGVNMSLGYEFDPEWFACGQSPLCTEVNRLVKSGIVVVVAAGNTGYGYNRSADRTDAVAAGMALSINDPGNAELAITVGSTHRYMPHTYGVSYFSSKGPTGDGRAKPDLVAPGEKIISCAAGRAKEKLRALAGLTDDFEYLEDSGTSMAAPHVSGVIAAFLSIRPEFRGEPEKVKSVFLGAATDLRREKTFQGAGLVDLMRAIQSV